MQVNLWIIDLVSFAVMDTTNQAGTAEMAWKQSNIYVAKMSPIAPRSVVETGLIREAFKKKLRNIWKIPYLRGGVSGGHFPYVIMEDLKCIESHFEHF